METGKYPRKQPTQPQSPLPVFERSPEPAPVPPLRTPVSSPSLDDNSLSTKRTGLAHQIVRYGRLRCGHRFLLADGPFAGRGRCGSSGSFWPDFRLNCGNRLHKGMKLQADPTVCFCFDYTLDRVLKKHLRVDSPYNTYKYYGLPPAPINVPPKACMDAVLSPDEHGYLYFCASPEFDGTHIFAVSYNEHLRNARAFQRALTARQKAKDRQASQL